MSKIPSRPVRSEGAGARYVPAKIDLSYRPRNYFWPHGLKPHPLSSIKGADRRALIGRVLAEDPDSYVPPVLLQSALPDPLRIFLGAQHPSAMGGEYLPDMEAEEVEVARITIASTTQDVTSIYARQEGRNIELRVVDEYDGDTLSGIKTRLASKPLSLGELTDFFMGAWNLCEVIQTNFEDDDYPEDGVFDFFGASSDFYPDFHRLLGKRITTFVRKRKAALKLQQKAGGQNHG